MQDEGSVAQFGTPMALYHRPQNLFTAEFIGSPKMNVLPGRLVRAEAEHAVVDVRGEQVTVAVDARSAAAGAAVTLGIRPEHLVEGEAETSSPLHTTLQHVERLGDASLLYLSVQPDAPLVTLRVEGAAAHQPGERITLRLRAQQCHLFDAGGQAFRRTVELPS